MCGHTASTMPGANLRSLRNGQPDVNRVVATAYVRERAGGAGVVLECLVSSNDAAPQRDVVCGKRVRDRDHPDRSANGRTASGRSMKLSDLDYDLPSSLIAQHPLDRPDASRLLVLPAAQ